MSKKSVEELLAEALVPEEEVPYEVPGNWVWVRVISVNDIVTGNTPSKNNLEYYGDYLPFIKPNDLEQQRNVQYATEYLSEKGANVARIIPKGSTLLCCIGSIGKAGYLTVNSATNQQINSLIPRKEIINSLFTYYYSLSPCFQKILFNRSSATTISIINKSKLSLLPFPLPPLQEQKRIVEKIESMFAKIDKAKEVIEEARESVESRKASIFAKAFKGELTCKWREENVNIQPSNIFLNRNSKNIKDKGILKTNDLPEGWVWVKIRDAFKIYGGGTPSKANPDYWNGTIPWISPKDMKTDVINSTEDCITYKGLELSSAKLAEEDSVVIVVRSGILSHTLPVAIMRCKAAVNQDLKVLDSGIVELNHYLFWYIKGNQKSLLDLYSKSGTTVPSIKMSDFSEHFIPVPPLEEITEFLNIISSLLEKDRLVETMTSIEENLEVLKKTILAKAFCGQLDANYPEEESAIEFLKNILQEKVLAN